MTLGDWINAKISCIGITRGAKIRAINNLISIVGQDFERHEVAHIFTEPHPSSMAFLAGGGKWAVIIVIIHRIIEREVKQLTDVIGSSSDHAQGGSTDAWSICVV
jgi:hypothetical protein